MSQLRRYPKDGEDLTYREWHRSPSIGRYTEIDPTRLPMIDIDGVILSECAPERFIPVALIEAQRSGGRYKSTSVVRQLAEMAGIPAYFVGYKASDMRNPSNSEWPDIDWFEVRRITPRPQQTTTRMTPKQYAAFVVALRRTGKDALDQRAA